MNVSVYGEDYTNFEDLKPGQAGDDKSDNSKKSKEDKLKNNLSTPGKKSTKSLTPLWLNRPS